MRFAGGVLAHGLLARARDAAVRVRSDSLTLRPARARGMIEGGRALVIPLSSERYSRVLMPSNDAISGTETRYLRRKAMTWLDSDTLV